MNRNEGGSDSLQKQPPQLAALNQDAVARASSLLRAALQNQQLSLSQSTDTNSASQSSRPFTRYAAPSDANTSDVTRDKSKNGHKKSPKKDEAAESESLPFFFLLFLLLLKSDKIVSFRCFFQNLKLLKNE